MELLALWIIFSVAVALFANGKNRSGFNWFLISMLTSPLIGFVFLMVMKPVEPKAKEA